MSARVATLSLAVASSYWGIKWLISRGSRQGAKDGTGALTAHPKALASRFGANGSITIAPTDEQLDDSVPTLKALHALDGAHKAVQLVFCIAACTLVTVTLELAPSNMALHGLLGILGMLLVSSIGSVAVCFTLPVFAFATQLQNHSMVLDRQKDAWCTYCRLSSS